MAGSAIAGTVHYGVFLGRQFSSFALHSFGYFYFQLPVRAMDYLLSLLIPHANQKANSVPFVLSSLVSSDNADIHPVGHPILIFFYA